jgi:hypothetical protein
MLIIVRAAHVVVATGAKQLTAAFLERRAAVGAGSDEAFQIRLKSVASVRPTIGAELLAVTHGE